LDAHAAASYYERLARGGIDLRERFQGLDGLWTGERSAEGAIRLPQEVEPRAVGGLHPVVIDSMLQLLGAAVSGVTSEGDTWLPRGIERVEFGRSADGLLRGHASLRALGDSTTEALSGEAWLVDRDGMRIFSASGVLVRRAPRELVFAADRQQLL